MVGIHHLLGDTDNVGVVDTDLAQQLEVVLLIHLLVDKVVEGLSLWDIGGVQPHDGGEEGAVPGVHQVAGVIGGGEGVEVVHRGHLVLDGDRDAMAVLHQLLDHAVDQLYLGELALIEEQAGGALGQEGVHAQGQGRRAGEDGSSPGGHPAAPGALAVPAVEIPLRHAHQQVQNQGRRHEYAGAAQDGLHVLLADAGGDDAAQASAAHKGGKDRGADGVDCGNADAGEDDGGGDGDLHMDEAVGTGHAHAPARLDQVLRHLVQPQAGPR